MAFQKIILPTRPQPDTVLGIFFLKNFGKERYPEIEKAAIEIWQELPQNETPESLEEKGVLVLDLAGGRFDHHGTQKTLSQLVAEDLEIIDDPAMSKLLKYGERDDKYGLGTISADSIDKAFGLSGLIAALNKALPESPEKVISAILPLITAHYIEEKKRTEEIPREFQELTEKNLVEVFEAKQDKKKIKAVALQSDNLSMAGWLRASEGLRADVVCQKLSSGYVNIITKPLKKIDLRWPAAYLRNEEAKLRSRRLQSSTFELMRPGKIAEAPEWYYDRATNSILNGGTNPKGINPTAIPFQRITEILKKALVQKPPQSRFSPQPRLPQYFLEIRVPAEATKEIKTLLKDVPAGIKLHLPENYHITLMYFNEIESAAIEKIKQVFENIKPFEIVVDSANFKSGKVSGYPSKTFYFEIKDKGETILKKIRQDLEEETTNFQKEEFLPHLSVATALPQIEEKVIEEAVMKIEKSKKIRFSVEKIRLTEVSRKSNGESVYRVKNQFYL